LRLQPIRPPRQLPEGGRPADLAFSPDGRLLAVGHANMPVVRLLDARTLELRGAPPLGQALGRQRQSLGAVAWTAGPGGQAVLHAAGYVLDAQGRSALLRWTNLQASPAAILPLGRDTIFHLQGLAGGRIAYAGAEPAWGVVAADGRAGLRLEGQGGDFRSIGAGLFRLRPDDTEFGRFPALGPGSFRISADAMIVEFGMDAGGQRPLRFDVRRRALEPSQASAPQAARPPLTLPLRDWMNGASPYFGTQRLRLSPGEHARSAAPLPDGGFLLGTDTHLRRYDARGGEVSQEAVMAAVWGVQASADGTQAVVALGDGTIRWHGLDAAGSMPERAAFFAHRDGRRWLLWTPEGFFDHSDQGGQDLAGYHLNRRVQDMAEWVNFAQLYRVFHAEDLVRARLAREDEAPLRQRLAEIGDVRRLLRQAPAPSVTISALCFTTAPDGAERCQDFSAGGAQTRGLSRLREAALPVAQAAAASGPAGAATLLELPSGVTRVRLRATLVDRGGGLGQTDMLLNGRNVGRNTDTRGLSR
ncbi:MAG: hypothetical protein EBY30_15715, partial [Rhodospirillales bacterium]|nr:hypothetical protein [Rhodospirillales bacterium]